MSGVSQRIAADENQPQAAIGAALPTMIAAMIAAMSRKAESDGGNSLLSMLDCDGDGSVLNDFVGYLGKGNHQSIGGSMLDGFFGNRRS